MIRAMRRFVVDDPYRGDVVAEVPLIDETEARRLLDASAASGRRWASRPLQERAAVAEAFASALQARRESIAHTITLQMGKPIAQSRAEVDTCLDRARTLIELAPRALAEEAIDAGTGFRKRITHEPLGVVLVIAPWNYPLLTSINVVLPALLAGNSVLLKPAPRTPLCAEQFARAFAEAGGDPSLLQPLFADHALVDSLIAAKEVGFVAFTGSVRGGREILRAASSRFVGIGLELGGKDPAYVAEDADLDQAVAGIVDGVCYNAGQSCCAVERIYVHARNFDAFVERALPLMNGYVAGDPTSERTSLGPMAQRESIPFLGGQVSEARSAGARILCGGHPLTVGRCDRFFAPTLIADAAESLSLLRDESFGPIASITAVEGDEEALRRMNESRFGLTASIWTRDPGRAEAMGERLEAGTIFLNRCDYVDPSLAWTGMKDSGLGATLSRHGFLSLTRRKSWHFRLP